MFTITPTDALLIRFIYNSPVYTAADMTILGGFINV